MDWAAVAAGDILCRRRYSPAAAGGAGGSAGFRDSEGSRVAGDGVAGDGVAGK